MVILANGLTLGICLIFAIAVVSKLGRTVNLEVTLMRLLPRQVWRSPVLNSRTLARTVLVAETALAVFTVAGLVIGVAVPALVTSSIVMAVFTLARERARRSGQPCSCTGRMKAVVEQTSRGRRCSLRCRSSLRFKIHSLVTAA